MTEVHKGSCCCGAVQYELRGALRPSVACHCTQCRKTSGHYWSATQTPSKDFVVTKDAGLKWFRSSDTARRAFCKDCGSSMFWQLDGEDATSVATGTLDGETGLTTDRHIFVADKGDYYEIETGPRQLDQY
ncbi:GFA family protein [Amylibacter sp. SFDW26]|uniref:GFA family protein n=1 Tax=Amylibacter sp. SFDW26 TaxID=2652722 RepID=UPI0012621D03|nr:GFA family protein [Amylibacter sp. SFDW26]KAB7614368.1 GFA family protein [Amylibacter sp. SFDW26]